MRKILLVSSMILVFAASIAMAKPASANILGGSNYNLGDLIILNQLFDGNGLFNGGVGTGTGTNLGNLIILDRLFSDGGGILGGGGTDLGDLIILDQLFGGNGLFGNGAGTGTGTNLGNLIILERLFSDGGGILGDGGGIDLGNLIILDMLFTRTNGDIAFDTSPTTVTVDTTPVVTQPVTVQPVQPAELPLATQLSGRILLQVEEEGQAWYVDPASGQRVFLGDPGEAFDRMSSLAVGITEQNFDVIQDAVPAGLAGNFVIRAEGDGQLYYANPTTRNLEFVGGPENALSLMQETGLGITNQNLNAIPTN
jgi:hypothetical protein